MNPQCARCGKIVYPTEKVSCLDKVSPSSGRENREGTIPISGESRTWRRVRDGRKTNLEYGFNYRYKYKKTTIITLVNNNSDELL